MTALSSEELNITGAIKSPLELISLLISTVSIPVIASVSVAITGDVEIVVGAVVVTAVVVVDINIGVIVAVVVAVVNVAVAVGLVVAVVVVVGLVIAVVVVVVVVVVVLLVVVGVLAIVPIIVTEPPVQVAAIALALKSLTTPPDNVKEGVCPTLPMARKLSVTIVPEPEIPVVRALSSTKKRSSPAVMLLD
jgi:hypothetical protein